MQLIRQKMVLELTRKGIHAGRVLEAMATVPRHLYVSEALRFSAYSDRSLPIGFGQTISKPSIIALMVQALNLHGDERILEIGTGSGYQTSILAELTDKVITMERIPELSRRAKNLLIWMGYSNIQFLATPDFNEALGLFDKILVCAGAEIMHDELLAKLKPHGTLLIPVSNGSEHIIKRYTKKTDNSIVQEEIGRAIFVPLIVNENIIESA